MPPRVLVVGLGEVGKPLYELARDSGRFEVYGYDVDPAESVNSLPEIPRPVDFLHVVFPYSHRFVEHVVGYVEAFRPRLVVIHSTVAVGTTRRIHEELGVPVAFSPVRGRHPRLKEHLRFWPKWVAALPGSAVDEAAEHLRSMGLPVRIYKGGPESLELAKLWETVYRAVMIAAWQELHRVARRFGADIVAVAEFVAEVHRVLRDRPVYYPGYIAGHCLIPNVKIMLGQHPSKLLEFVIESNERRAVEVKDPGIAREVEELKKLFLELTDRGYYGEEAR